MREEKIKWLTEHYMRQEGMTERKLKNRLRKEEEIELAERTQKSVDHIVVTIEWKKSATWGMNPHAVADVYYKDGTRTTSETFKASGCGYDKESSVFAEVCNKYLKYLLWGREDMDNTQKPYGIYLDFLISPHFSGGIGMSCYYKIGEFLGFKLEHNVNHKTLDVYTITMI